MQEYKKIKYRYFILSFSVAFFVLSLTFFFLMRMVHPASPLSLVNEPAAEEVTSYYPSREESLSVLFVGVGPDGSEGETFLLARFDPAKGSVPIVVFPRETLVRNGDKQETLAEVYKYGGAGYTRGRLSETLGIDIDRYVRMDVAAFLVAAATVGTVEYNLPDEIVLEQGGVASMTLSPGIQLLDGTKVAEIFRYGDYAGGEPARCAMVADLTAAIVNQRMDIALSTVVDKVFEKIINIIDTDISYSDYDDRKEAAAFLARMSSDPAAPLQLSGSYNAETSQYNLSDTFIAMLIQNFS